MADRGKGSETNGRGRRSDVFAGIGIRRKVQVAELESFIEDLQQRYPPDDSDTRDAARLQRENLKALRKALAHGLRAARATRRALARASPDAEATPHDAPRTTGSMRVAHDLRSMRRLGRAAKRALVQTRRPQGRPGIDDLVEAAHALIEKIADLKGTKKSEELAGLRSYKGRGETLENFLIQALRSIAPNAPAKSIATAIKRAAAAARKTD